MADINQHATGDGAQLAGGDIHNDFHFDADAVESVLAYRPSHVAKVIVSLADKLVISDQTDGNPAIDPYGIQNKIDFNNVIIYREVFERYAGFGSVIDSVCDNLDVDVPDIKRKLFAYIQTQYSLGKGAILKKNLLLSDHSDDVISAIKENLRELVINDIDTAQISKEDIELSVIALVTKAFMDCKLLEHPPHS